MNDNGLIQIVDAAMAEAVRKSGTWIACRPGCYECCIGPFAITQLDALRLREGLAALAQADPARARRVSERADALVERLQQDYPENTVATVLAEDNAAENDLCPALNPQTGTCDLYAYRPITCRTFGPAVRFGGESVAICELCYQGATDDEIAACEVRVDLENIDSRWLRELEESTGVTGETLVAFALGK